MATAWCVFTSVPASVAASQSRPVTMTHQGTERQYHLYVPPGLGSSARRASLVLVLHGGGGRGTQIEWATRYQFNKLAADHRFIVAYPDGIKRGWNDGRHFGPALRHRTDFNDVNFLETIIDDIRDQLPVNTQRVFAAGMSNGAMMALRLVCDSDRFKAVAAVAGNLPAPLAKACNAAGKSILLINGKDDAIVPYGGGRLGGVRAAKDRGQVLSARQTFALFGQANGCEATETIPVRDLFADDTTVSRHQFVRCKRKVRIEQWRILGGGHTWPGARSRAPRFLIGVSSRELDATAEIWRFFSQHPQ